MSNDAQPEIRFPGFTEDWEERKLRELLDLLKDGTHGTHSDVEEGVYLLSAKNIKNGIVNIDSATDRKISKQEFASIHKNFNLEKGDVLLTIVGSIGESAIIENPEGITFQRSVAYLRPNKMLSSLFLYNNINGSKFQAELKKRQVISAQPGIYLGDLAVIPIKLPTLTEQIKIGAFFSVLNKTIALHQRKLDLLKETKKGFLQKMFPKNGAKVPEIRFPGFTEDWEERKLGELTESFDGKRVPIDSDLRISGKYPYYGATGIIDYVDDYIFNGEYVLLAEDGANIIMRNYPVAYLTQGKFWLNNHAHIMRMRNGSNYFLVQVLEKIDYKKYNTGTAQPKLNSKIVKNIELKIPHIEEQQQIGNFFKQLDDIIALHQRKLDLLKETKKGFLQKMFV
ncbi:MULTISPECIES: restriction endonuclease subunit S [Enterococcus]|nr:MULTISPECIES: restriction endonuclease subunit S [Enterococcus]EGP4757341.1 restriction endonuclease subunit S [Enterococcus faecium]EME3565118.1 restriction endonuclease subunit S [Enterococcus faecium]EME8183746.1 restriction endonuclease subunit S [Enterococcus faecium]EMF0306758.1 restriction endonuclease subunit S [Enterococcus faecium]MDQ8351407.1 restriction endonuclease subunit S [Enterococcus faecium]